MGPGRPVVYEVSSWAFTETTQPTLVQDLEIHFQNGSLALFSGAEAHRVAVFSAAGDACNLQGATITDSLCWAAASRAISLHTTTASEVDNVTTHGQTFGLIALDNAANTVRGSILSGTNNQAVRVDAGTTTVHHSSVPSVVTTGGGVYTADANITQPGTFVDAVHFDYREALGSPTIDTGDDTVTSAFDLNGNLRQIGGHVDMGAFERVPTPTGTTDAPIVNPISATLNGTVDGQGGQSTYHFEYGPDTSYASSTPDKISGAVLGSLPVSTSLLSLPDAPTHYRLVATTDGGTVTGADQLVPGKPVPTAGDATAVGTTTATLGGTIDLRGAATGAVRFVYGSDTTSTQSHSAGAVSADLAGLAPNTTYSWKVEVQTDRGLVASGVKQFTTLPEVPAASSGDVSNLTTTGANLDGIADTKGVQGQVAMLVDGKAVGETTRYGGPFSVDVTGLAPGTPHTYQLRVITTGGSALGAEKTFTTPAAPPKLGATLKLATALTKHQLSLKRTSVAATVACTGLPCTVKVSAVVTAGKKTLGKLTGTSGRVAAGKTARFTLKVPKKLRKRLAKGAKLTLTAVAKGGATTITRRVTVTIRRPKS